MYINNQRAVRKFYRDIPLGCLPRTDGGFGIFAANANIMEPPHVLGVGDTPRCAWEDAHNRILIQRQKDKLACT